MRPPRALPAAVTVVALLFAACSSVDDEPSATDETDAPAGVPLLDGETFAAYNDFRAAPTACGADRPDPVTPMAFDRPDDQELDPNTPITVTIETSCGDLTVELTPSLAPFAVNSFVFLADKGFYDGTVSHRVMPGFMFQAGDPTASGGGNPGYHILLDEWPPEGFAYDRGVMAMANSGPSSTGSQFFIMLDNYSLPPNYTVIGRIVSGDEVLDDIAAIPVTNRPSGEPSLPEETLYIERIRVTSGS